MSKEDLEFLIDLQKRMNEQDETSEKCDYQASPYFWGVAENKIEWGVDYSYSGNEICFIHDCEQYNTIEECKDFFMGRLDDDIEEDDEIKEIENISNWSDIEDYINEHDIEGNIVYGRKNEDIISKYTGCFLTKQACKDHIEKYGYNYSEPHTFAMTADRNPEFERVWNILKKTDWKQLAKLKAENERLKEEIKESNKTIWDENEKAVLCGDCYCTSNFVREKIVKIKNLQQQLKEKDELIRTYRNLYNTCHDDYINVSKELESKPSEIINLVKDEIYDLVGRPQTIWETYGDTFWDEICVRLDNVLAEVSDENIE